MLPQRWAPVSGSSDGSCRCANSDQSYLVPNVGRTPSATYSARRDLPTPPTPISVAVRNHFIILRRSALSRRRPTKPDI
jgi:hypothetical protein